MYFSGTHLYYRADPPIPQADLSIPQADLSTIDSSCLRHTDLPIDQANLSIHQTDLSATHKKLPTYSGLARTISPRGDKILARLEVWGGR